MSEEKNRPTLTIYQPNRYLKMGLIRICILMWKDLLTSLPLGWRLFLRDYSAKYRQQLFGYLWAFFSPLVAVIPFVLLVNAAVLNVSSIDAPYPIYAFLGVSFWGVIQGTTVSVSNIINTTGTMIAKINFPKESLIISPVMISVIDILIKILLFMGLCLAYGYYRPFTGMFYIFAVIPALFLGIGLGLFLSIVGAVFKDITTILGFLFQFLMLATPILYNRPSTSILSTISVYNPFYYLVVVPRDLLLTGSSVSIEAYAWCSMGTFVIFLAGWRFYKVAVARIIERI